ncbi:hypothetical protein SMICM304S_03122 [Streptomyces microflavus]
MLIGPDRVPDAVLSGLLEGVRDRAALERRLTRLPGLYHVVARLSGETWIRGTASGLRRIYHAPHAEAGTIASDRPAVLAHLTGAPLDDGALALRMLDFLPHPLSRRVLWRGVHETGAGYGLALPAAAPGTATAPGPREYRWREPAGGTLLGGGRPRSRGRRRRLSYGPMSAAWTGSAASSPAAWTPRPSPSPPARPARRPCPC